MCMCNACLHMLTKFLHKTQNINGRDTWIEVASFQGFPVHMHAASNGELGRALKHDYVEQTYIHKTVIRLM